MTWQSFLSDRGANASGAATYLAIAARGNPRFQVIFTSLAAASGALSVASKVCEAEEISARVRAKAGGTTGLAEGKTRESKMPDGTTYIFTAYNGQEVLTAKKSANGQDIALTTEQENAVKKAQGTSSESKSDNVDSLGLWTKTYQLVGQYAAGFFGLRSGINKSWMSGVGTGAVTSYVTYKGSVTMGQLTSGVEIPDMLTPVKNFFTWIFKNPESTIGK
jgi:hypothetical protein